MVDLDTYFVPIFLHTAMCEISYMIFLVAVDVLYMTFVQHCCGLLAALRYTLENSFEFEGNVDGLMTTYMKHSKNNRSYSIIAYCIRRHSEAIQFIDILESLFRLPLLMHMGCIITIISIVGFQVITNAESMSRVLRHCIYFSGSVLNAFFENWQGQKIIDYSEKVYEAAYNAQWYEMPNAARKLLIMIMLRSIKPSQVTAGKIIIMSYMNFNAVMRLSSSYFMLLQSMQ
ncbi:putative odorant receptor 85d [Harpegnathos saltator]|uniref:putative odorant receptor 85d n=1 Tax=Harpegnathos saltator TaxID=610380 RepID=UPI0009490778|nr:putative odorant receptor 85d [Harpegnathos saltator]